jgi:hypothetical protein
VHSVTFFGADPEAKYRPNLCLILKTELQKSSHKYHCNKTLLVTAFIALYKHVSIYMLRKFCLYFILFIIIFVFILFV